MILPTIIGVSESAIRAVPNKYYEGALALGATHERSVYCTVVPAAKSGIMAGIVLGIGRAIGETMAVIMVAGNQARMPKGIFKGIRTLTGNIVIEMGYATDLHREALIATGVVLFVFILMINLLLMDVEMKIQEPINKVTRKQKLKNYSKHPGSFLLALLTKLAILLTVLALGFILIYILVKGIPNLSTDLFALKYTTENVSMLPAIINTLIITLLSLCIAGPIGIFSAIYLVEYAKKGNKLVEVVRVTAETLTGIPSIVYGLFGMLFFVTTLKCGYSILAGALTLSIMVLPVIMRTTEEALLAVPNSFREGSFGLGAGKLRTIFKIVLPSAVPGILAGVILAIGRMVGETAALIYTAGTVAEIPSSIMSSGRTLAIHMYSLSKEGLYTNQAYATAVVLLIVVVLINMLSNFVAKKFTKK